jgi:hypothetical protein
MLERLKRLFSPRSRGPEVEYDRPSGDGPATVPAGPPTTPYAPAAPLEGPALEEPEPKP